MVVAIVGCGGATPEAERAEAEAKRQVAGAIVEAKRQLAEAKAEAKRQVADAEAFAKQQIAEAEAALVEAEKQVAVKEAAVEAEANRVSSEWEKSRVAVEAAVEAASAGLTRAEDSLASCRTRARAAETRRTAALQACQARARAAYRQCEDDCSEAATRCRRANALRPNAREACDDKLSTCAERCESAANRICAALEPSETDPCDSENAALNNAKAVLERASAPATEAQRRESNSRNAAASARVRAKNIVAAAQARVELVKEESQALVERVKKETNARVDEVRKIEASRITDLRRGGVAQLDGGTFASGETKETVTVAAFALDLTEVTVDAYARCVSAGKCSAPDTGRFCNWNVGGKGNHPINCVDWNQATAYCEWAGKRLPSEAEWEWAARGQARGTKYPWGNEAPESRACWNRAGQGTCAVGAFRRGDAPGGIDDLAGNVWEWTSTAYTSSARAFRGGGWVSADPSFLRAANRDGGDPSYRVGDLGFRCAR
jgi:formylglycine-generating enzyme required for sulfatase activity